MNILIILTTLNDSDFWSKLVAIENLFGTAGSAVVALILTALIRQHFSFNPQTTCFIISLLMSGLMVSFSEYEGMSYCIFITVLNASLILGIANSLNDLLLNKKPTNGQKSGKMGGVSDDLGSSEKKFFRPWN